MKLKIFENKESLIIDKLKVNSIKTRKEQANKQEERGIRWNSNNSKKN